MIIDTNVYSAIDMGVQSATDILDNAAELLIPLPVVAELRFGFVRGSRRAENESRLQTLLSQPNVQVLCPTLQTSVIYAELQLICVQKRARIVAKRHMDCRFGQGDWRHIGDF